MSDYLNSGSDRWGKADVPSGPPMTPEEAEKQGRIDGVLSRRGALRWNGHKRRVLTAEQKAVVVAVESLCFRADYDPCGPVHEAALVNAELMLGITP